jgi:hypothetical protein
MTWVVLETLLVKVLRMREELEKVDMSLKMIKQ